MDGGHSERDGLCDSRNRDTVRKWSADAKIMGILAGLEGDRTKGLVLWDVHVNSGEKRS